MMGKLNRKKKVVKAAISHRNLFWSLSSLSDEEKVEIADWYDSLSPEHRAFVEMLRADSAEEASFYGVNPDF